MGKVVSFADEKNKRKKQRRYGSYAWLGWVFAVLAALVLGYGVGQSSLFVVRNIEVSGLSRLTEEEVVGLSGLETGEHILAANLGRAETMLLTNIWVEQVELGRRLPSTIEIAVQERVPAAAITTAEGLYIVDSSGMLLVRQKLLDGLSIVAVSGITGIDPETRLGSLLEGDAISAALSIIRQMDEAAASLIAELNVADPQKIIARTSYGVDFYLGDKSDFLQKFALAQQILQSETDKGLRESLDYIDVSLVEQPVLAYLQ